MFFEGPEKKLEIVVSSAQPSLRDRGDDYWGEVVGLCHAKILSKISNSHCDAYLLSESSLFVYDDHLILITCGQTTLVQSVLKLVADLPEIESLFFERKNEHFAHYQSSDFFQDIQKIRKQVPGVGYKFGDEDEHHLLLFHMDRPYKPSPEDRTLEVLMHGIGERAQDIFSKKDPEGLEHLGIREIFQGYQVDEYWFDPKGYSLNAIKDEHYYTMHVTPERFGSYVSFETNAVDIETANELVQQIIEVFQPESCDVIAFLQEENLSFELGGYLKRRHVRQALCGYTVEFNAFYRPQERVAEATRIPEEL